MTLLVRQSIRRASSNAVLVALFFGASGALVDASSPTPLAPARTFELSPGFNNAWGVTFDSHAQFVATENRTGDVEIWDTNTGQRSAAWPAGSTPRAARNLSSARPAAMAFLPSGDLLVGRGTNIAIHNRANGRPQRTLPSTLQPISSIIVARDGTRACAVLAETLPATLAFWDLTNGRRMDGLPLRGGQHFIGGYRPPNGPDFLVPGLSRSFGWDNTDFLVGDERLVIERWDLTAARVEARSGASRRPGHVTAVAAAGPDRIASVRDDQSLLLHDRNLRQDSVLLTNLPPGDTSATGLIIRALAVSGDGQCIAVGGMRAGARPGVFAPKGDFVVDVPIRGEIQVWDASTERIVAILKGASDEKFLRVGLDVSGHRVVAASAGVRYTSRMMGAHQQSLEMNPTNTVRVSVWELPHR